MAMTHPGFVQNFTK